MTKTAALALAVALLAAVGCGGAPRPAQQPAPYLTSTEAAVGCDDLFADGAVLPADEAVPGVCRRARGDLSAVVWFTCPDGSRLYQVDVSGGGAWARSGGEVRVVPDPASDPAYGEAYRGCQ